MTDSTRNIMVTTVCMLFTLATVSGGTITEPPDAIILTAEDVGGNRLEAAGMRRRIANKEVQSGDFTVRLPGKPGQKPGFRNPHAMAIAFLYPYVEEMQATEGGITTIAADLELFPDAVAAKTAPISPENTTVEDLESRISGAPGVDSAMVETAFVDQFPAASSLAAYRLTYRLGGSPVFEYRVRMRIDNAIAQLMVVGRPGMSGSIPSNVEERVQDVIQRWLNRLETAAGK